MNFKPLIFSGIALLGACTSALIGPYSFTYTPIQTNDFEIATWQHITTASDPIHIYIEGDGYAFNRSGQPTRDPTPRKHLVRNLASKDTSPNVVYMGRPCQYIRGKNCDTTDWTDGRFSKQIIDNMSQAIKSVAKGRPIILVGYSGGAMVSGLVIKQHPELNIKKWITIAGVLNHKDWTKYFNDKPLSKSLNMNGLPQVSQIHYIAEHDSVVPNSLSRKWVSASRLTVIPNAKHDYFPKLDINFK